MPRRRSVGGDVKPFVLARPDQFQPAPPPSLSSATWVADFNEIKAIGRDTSTTRTAAQTATARFYTANVPRQWNRLVRDIAESHSLGLLQTARLAAMINVVAADAGIAVLNAKYHYLFWRPVTAIDPGSVKPTCDGFGPTPGFDDGNPATVEQPGWRPLVTTPDHPGIRPPTAPSPPRSMVSRRSSAPTGSMSTSTVSMPPVSPAHDAVHHFSRANQLRREIINARTWGRVHYRTPPWRALPLVERREVRPPAPSRPVP
jgi:hypothetical protein